MLLYNTTTITFSLTSPHHRYSTERLLGYRRGQPGGRGEPDGGGEGAGGGEGEGPRTARLQ